MTNTRLEKGMETFRKIDPLVADSFMQMMKPLCPELAEMTIAFGYGEIMSREGIDLRTRELLNVAMLGAMGNAPVQLEMHIKGALNTGSNRAEILEVVLQIAAYAGFPAAYNTLSAANKIFGAMPDKAS
jgi:4-carboxymuconolactone decarboxylase